MPYTTPLGIQVPAAGDVINVGSDFKTLADTTNSAIAAVNQKLYDTGWVNLTPLNGYTVQTVFQIRRVGALVQMRGRLNIPPSMLVKIAQIPYDAATRFLPVGAEHLSAAHVTSGSGGVAIQVIISTTGSVDIWTATSGTSLGALPMDTSWFVN